MISYNSEIGNKIINDSQNAANTLKNDFANKIDSNFAPFNAVGLFSAQLNSIKSAVIGMATDFETLASLITENMNSWQNVASESKAKIINYTSETKANVPAMIPVQEEAVAGSTDFTSDMEKIVKGKEVTTGDIKSLIGLINTDTMPILLQKMNTLADGEYIVDLLFDKSKSNVLTTLLKKLLGNDEQGILPASLDDEEIQKLILEKINSNGYDLTTEEGRSSLEKEILEQLNVEVDESLWEKLLYGDNVVKYEGLDGTWVVANTKNELSSYVSYIESEKVYQEANQAEWGDKCLSFADTYTYDLIFGERTDGSTASKYKRSNVFNTIYEDTKEELLGKVYDQITSGKPVILQVNGNKAGTSRHFVTVVGFKEGVISRSTIRETDLLIIDSWDGKLERMDTSTSRFLTTGKDCGKNYTGYRMAVLSDSVVLNEGSKA